MAPDGFSAAALKFFETNETVTPKIEPNASVAPPPAQP
jgi:preprotein translocase subunit Sec61beta